MKALFVRHGETPVSRLGDEGPANPPERTPLTDKGLMQARQAAEICLKESVSAVYASPYLRTRQTANIIASRCDAPVKLMRDLRERDWGQWSNHQWGTVSGLLDQMDIDERYRFMPPGGESWQGMEQRARKAMDEIIGMGHEAVAIVSHKGLLRALVSSLLAEQHEQTIGREILTGEVTMLTLHEDVWSVENRDQARS